MTTKSAELEALLYVAGEAGLSENDLADLLQVVPYSLTELVANYNEQLKERQSGLKVIKVNDLYKLVTSPEVSKVVEQFFQKDLAQKLSQSALEILSIIAYRQPITRIEIDEIRGVNSSGALQTLTYRGLVKASGHKDVPGHPKLYVTTDYFLQYFGYESLDDLPLIEDFQVDEEPDNVELFKE
ncbi:MAG: SMC-Scp complex subunit ScpB [Lactobacillus sp.]|nr:SMC-Scp complex subunit ScpB [Lactobacillus sp.]